MSCHSGTNIVEDGLVLYLDAANTKSAIRSRQVSNVLVDPNTWVAGTGGSSGYGANGAATEQLRSSITDDPWGGTSVVWGTTPDAVSGADGGWNSSYYAIDTSYTYKYSMWVRRHTAGTGGTAYMGMNPAPIRNDTGAVQGNPYFMYTAQANLVLNQWYLVVGHCFYEGYPGNRHQESGWYTLGQKIADLSYGNVGAQDVRWNPGTTTAMHRAYHYYTTNIASGLQFAYPRLDKCDGSEPTVNQLLNTGESLWSDISNNGNGGNLINGTSYSSADNGTLVFDGVDDYNVLPNDVGYTSTFSQFAWFKSSGTPLGGYHIVFGGAEAELSIPTAGALRIGVQTPTRYVGNLGSGLTDGTWHYVGMVYNPANSYIEGYINGVSVGTVATTGLNPTASFSRTIGRFGTNTSYYANGNISLAQIYNKALTAAEVEQNYNTLKGRYSL